MMNDDTTALVERLIRTWVEVPGLDKDLQELLELVNMVNRVRQRALLEGAKKMAKAWETHFNERELKEIAFARTYAVDFDHGTDGHIRLSIMARMAELLDNGLVPHILKDLDPTKPVNPRKPQSIQD